MDYYPLRRRSRWRDAKPYFIGFVTAFLANCAYYGCYVRPARGEALESERPGIGRPVDATSPSPAPPLPAASAPPLPGRRDSIPSRP